MSNTKIMALADAYEGMSRLLPEDVAKARSALEAEIDRVVAENERLREALKNLLQDTQHAEHEDCEDGPCPVREARAALGES